MRKTSTQISLQIARGTQDVNYVEVLQDGSSRIKIEIRSDAYKFQSFARVSYWAGDRWERVHEILPEKMCTPHGLYSRPILQKPLDPATFSIDAGELLRVARQVLRGVPRP